MNFQKISVLKRMRMSLPELEEYYKLRRKYLFEQKIPLKRIRLREFLYPVFILLLKADRFFRKQKIEILGGSKDTDVQTIYACTHIAENDLENIYEAIHRGCWWFVGDPCVLYKDISGLWLYLNGCILLELNDKTDRHIAYLRAVELLKGGGSLMIFPEGARNVSENLPVMPLFQGTAKMSMVTNARIVPVAIEQYGKRFVINFGEALLPGDYKDHFQLTQDLRNAMASLKWEIWEREGTFKRASLPENYADIFSEKIKKRLIPWDTSESVERARYHTVRETEQRAFETHLNKLIPCRENAFLLRKDNG